MAEYTRHRGGRGWRYQADGTIAIEGIDGTPRTKGEPVTMRTLDADYGEFIGCAALHFGVSPATIAAVIVLESVAIPGTFTRDPTSYRWEERIQEPSVGLMQTLLSTAKMMDAKYKLGLKPNKHSLKQPHTSIMLGTAYLATLAERYVTTDGVLLQAAYNAGGVYYTKKNEWRLRTFAADRTERFIRWHNDWMQR